MLNCRRQVVSCAELPKVKGRLLDWRQVVLAVGLQVELYCTAMGFISVKYVRLVLVSKASASIQCS